MTTTTNTTATEPTLALDEEALERAVRFAEERQRVWWRRHVERSRPPWTDDPVLAGHRFTNLFRELDPGTTWAVRQILQRPDASVGDRLFNLMVYRLVGREETAQRIGFLRPERYRPVDLIAPMQAMRQEGRPPFTEAYMVYPCHQVVGATGDKVVDVALAVGELARDWDALMGELRDARSRDEAHAALCGPYGWGRFVAFQVLVDACYPYATPGTGYRSDGPAGPRIVDGRAQLLLWHNDGWVALGPGAERGLRRIFPGATPRRQQSAVRRLVAEVRERMSTTWNPAVVSADGRSLGRLRLDAANACNLLCEFDKYERYAETGRAGRGRLFDPRDAWREDRIAEGYGRQLDLLG